MTLTRQMIILIYLSAVLLPAIAHADQAQDLENMVTCKETPSAIQTTKDIRDQKGFKNAGGNFYTPTSPIKPFGFPVKYIGLLGVDMVPGPNITVEATLKKVKPKIINSLNKKFECGPGGCGAEAGKNVQIMIYPHPTDSKLTIIQCGYFGP